MSCILLFTKGQFSIQRRFINKDSNTCAKDWGIWFVSRKGMGKLHL